MAKILLPKSNFKPHPMGQFLGTVYACHLLEKVETPYGLQDKVIIKIASDLELVDDENKPKKDDDGDQLFFTLWDWVPISKTGRLKDRREQITGTTLTKEDLESGDFDTDDLIEARVGFTVKHNPNTKDPSKVYANIDALWRYEDQAPNPAHAHLIDHSEIDDTPDFSPTAPPPTEAPASNQGADPAVARIAQGLLDTIGSLEAAAGFTEAQLIKQRMKYLGDDDLAEVTDPAAAEAYIERLNLFIGDDD